eukprot:TRINITY_DN18942_c0_g1_i1.p1 TRINITY_DN18942_c0_g1~~TRINITY_DN18942_c0_g1_i1.p1  ORF type:complete len:466 (+),score=144.09 TRINITY_DN18942_c0_g1_i1:46-1443(+)
MRGPKKGANNKRQKPKPPPKASGKRVHLVRPPQPVPLPMWKAVDDNQKYEYAWGTGRYSLYYAERLAVTIDEGATYSYIHLLECTDGRLDHWVKTSCLRPRGHLNHEERDGARVRWVDHIIFGDYSIPAWYSSPFPSSLHPSLLANGGKLYICEICLKYTTDPTSFAKHKSDQGSCGGEGPLRGLHHPPGYEIYNSYNWAVWEVDGGDSDASVKEDEKMIWEQTSVQAHTPKEGSITQIEAQTRARYCHTLSLISRMFLEHKLNKYGTNPFRFYVLTEVRNNQYMLRGMFSKEKGHFRNNLSCIVMLPPWQGSGWGKRLIHMSYLLSRIEQTIGIPEQPLSQLGTRVYSTYFKGQIMDYLRSKYGEVLPDTEKLLSDISSATSIDYECVVKALEELSSPEGKPQAGKGCKGKDAKSGEKYSGIDWPKLLEPSFVFNAERPELQLNQSQLFHISHHSEHSQPIIEI